MKCGQEKCQNDGEYRYVWPGDGKQHEICSSCLPRMVRLAQAMNVTVGLQRIAVIDARNAIIRCAFGVWRVLPVGDDGKLAGEHPREMHELVRAVEQLITEEAKSIESAASIEDVLTRVVALRDAQRQEAKRS